MIDIKPDTHALLMQHRREGADTADAILRRLLGLPPCVSSSGGLMLKGERFPEGTQFRATCKGKTYLASIRDGRWTSETGIVFPSPSNAAAAVTGTNISGWRFWSARFPGERRWRRLEHCRPSGTTG